MEDLERGVLKCVPTSMVISFDKEIEEILSYGGFEDARFLATKSI